MNLFPTKTPMYKLLIIMLRNMYLFKDENICGLCILSTNIPVLWHDHNDLKVDKYISTHRPFSYWLRNFLFDYTKLYVSPVYYWKLGWELPRKWYLIRHIFYCWLWYWCSKPFKSK